MADVITRRLNLLRFGVIVVQPQKHICTVVLPYSGVHFFLLPWETNIQQHALRTGEMGRHTVELWTAIPSTSTTNSTYFAFLDIFQCNHRTTPRRQRHREATWADLPYEWCRRGFSQLTKRFFTLKRYCWVAEELTTTTRRSQTSLLF